MHSRARLRSLLLAVTPLALLTSMTAAPAAPAMADSVRCHAAATGNWAPNCTQRQGDRNRLVVAIQVMVNGDELCAGIQRINGRYNSSTRRWVRCYQRQYHLHVNGVVNRQTWRALQNGLFYYNTRRGWRYYLSSGVGDVDFRESVGTGAWYYGRPRASSEWVRMNSKAPKIPPGI